MRFHSSSMSATLVSEHGKAEKNCFTRSQNRRITLLHVFLLRSIVYAESSNRVSAVSIVWSAACGD